MLPKIFIHQDLSAREQAINECLSQFGFSNPDVDLLYLKDDEKLGVEAVKKIREFLSIKPYQKDKKAVVAVSAGNLTPEAQNALLKSLEEPPKDSIIILGVSSEAKLLPTILSRCQIININQKSDQSLTEKFLKDIDDLVHSSYEQRFQFIEKLEEKEVFLQALTVYFRKNLASHISSGDSSYLDFLKELIEAQKYALQNVNIRAILEYLMLKMPQAKLEK